MSKRLLTAAAVLCATVVMTGVSYALNPQPEPPGRYRKQIKPENPGYPLRARTQKRRKIAPAKPAPIPQR